MGDGQVPARLLLVHVASLCEVEKVTPSTQSCTPAPFTTDSLEALVLRPAVAWSGKSPLDTLNVFLTYES